MSKDSEKEVMLKKLSEMPDMVIATAYLYATHYCEFGADVTRQWTTAVAQSVILDQAYSRGYCEGRNSRPKGEWFHYEGTLTCSNCHSEFDDSIMEYLGDDVPRFCPWCGADMRGEKK